MIPFLIPAIIIVLIIVAAVIVWYFVFRKKTYHVLVMSAGGNSKDSGHTSSVLVTQDPEMKDMEGVEIMNTKKRGLTLAKVVRGGKLEVVGHYDLYASTAAGDSFTAAFTKLVEEGAPIIVTAHDDFVTNSSKVKATLMNAGSTEVGKAVFRSPFIFIMGSDGKVLVDQTGDAETRIQAMVEVTV